MKFQYIVEKENHKICIEVEAYVRHLNFEYSIADIGTKPKGKRKFNFIARQISDSYEYRRRNQEERAIYAKEQFLKYVSEAEIEAAVDYVYSQIKPDFGEITYKVF